MKFEALIWWRTLLCNCDSTTEFKNRFLVEKYHYNRNSQDESIQMKKMLFLRLVVLSKNYIFPENYLFKKWSTYYLFKKWSTICSPKTSADDVKKL